MSLLAGELSKLFARDLGRLRTEIAAFPSDELLWQALPGVTNSAGNLALHLEGNLREFIGRQLGGTEYLRDRPLEFSLRGLTRAILDERLAALEAAIPPVVAALSEAQLSATFPENVLGELLPVRHFVIHLHGHLTYHLGQINYLRRLLTSQ